MRVNVGKIAMFTIEVENYHGSAWNWDYLFVGESMDISQRDG